MIVTIELSDEQAAALKAKAEAQGLTLENWIQKLAVLEAPVAPRGRREGRYRLSELMDECDIIAPLSEEDRFWMDAPARGREAL